MSPPICNLQYNNAHVGFSPLLPHPVKCQTSIDVPSSTCNKTKCVDHLSTRCYFSVMIIQCYYYLLYSNPNPILQSVYRISPGRMNVTALHPSFERMLKSMRSKSRTRPVLSPVSTRPQVPFYQPGMNTSQSQPAASHLPSAKSPWGCRPPP